MFGFRKALSDLRSFCFTIYRHRYHSGGFSESLNSWKKLQKIVKFTSVGEEGKWPIARPEEHSMAENVFFEDF